MLREGMFIAERYEIIEKIGSGGMSDVYKAKCHKLNRCVAIKVLKNEFSEDKSFVAKFRAEAQSAAGLMHANIVNVYDVGEENGIYYIVMELVEGITLKKYIEKKGRLGIREAVSIAIQVAQGMDAAHKHKIVHRDIKPQNIIISKEGKVKVTDFGIAKAASSNTINSTVMGSVHYISPEQARGGYSDDKSDIYSFGIMLFEMLTGRVPFEGDTTVAIALQHIQDDIVSPKDYVPEIPVSVEKIVLKCTQKKTEKRYQNAMDLIADLKRSLVTPDEDFVVIASAVAIDAPTQMIDSEDVAQISAMSRQKSVGLDVINPSHDGLEPVSTDDVAEDTEEDEVVVAPVELDEEEEDINLAASKKMDKIITIIGISVGVVIFIILIILLFKIINMFSGNKTTTIPTNNQTTTADDGLVEVPVVIGYTYEQAKEILNTAGLGIKEIYDFSSTYEAGIVFQQSIDAGTRATPNSTVIVTISKGAVTFVLPDVLGNDQATADSTLKGKDLKVSYQYEETDNSILWGTVKSSSPEAGTSVKSGDVVTLVIYTGPDVVNETVPSIKDEDGNRLTATELREKLNALLFTKVTVEYEYDEEIEKGLVISLTGATEGEKAPVTTPITLIVSKGPDPSKATEDSTTEAPTTEAPTTEAPTTEEPTTEAPTTAEPTTEEPATETPTDEDATTVATTVTFTGSVTRRSVTDIVPDTATNIKVDIRVKDANGADVKVDTKSFATYSDLDGSANFSLSGITGIEGLTAGDGEAYAAVSFDGSGTYEADNGGDGDGVLYTAYVSVTIVAE